MRAVNQALAAILAEGQVVVHALPRRYILDNIAVALVDIGAETTDLALYYGDEILYAKSLPFGGRHITDDLSHFIVTCPGEAEKMRIRHGCADPALVAEDLQVPYRANTVSGHRIAEVIWHRFDEIARAVDAEIRRNIGRSPLAAGIYFTGGTSRLRGAVEVPAAVTGKSVWLGRPQATLNGQQLRDPLCAATLGLISFNNALRPPTGVVKKTRSRFYKYLYGENDVLEVS